MSFKYVDFTNGFWVTDTLIKWRTEGFAKDMKETHFISAPEFALQASLAVSDSDTAALQCLMTEILAAWEMRGRRRRTREMLVIVMLLGGDPHCYWGLWLECCMTLSGWLQNTSSECPPDIYLGEAHWARNYRHLHSDKTEKLSTDDFGFWEICSDFLCFHLTFRSWLVGREHFFPRLRIYIVFCEQFGGNTRSIQRQHYDITKSSLYHHIEAQY